ncbi:hypothetical protein GALMADRAFT_265483, partial [Galerina marginata CBS 339.88]
MGLLADCLDRPHAITMTSVDVGLLVRGTRSELDSIFRRELCMHGRCTGRGRPKLVRWTDSEQTKAPPSKQMHMYVPL